MEANRTTTSFGLHFSQICWVVKDSQPALKFFQEIIGIKNFVSLENIRAEDHEGTYYGNPGTFVFHLHMGYSGESMIELIQPVSGPSIYQDFLGKHSRGGIQHIAYMVNVADFDKATSELANKGYPIITTINLPIAKVAYFDTYKEIGVATEIIGATEAGEEFVQSLRTPR